MKLIVRQKAKINSKKDIFDSKNEQCATYKLTIKKVNKHKLLYCHVVSLIHPTSNNMMTFS